jgi:hypothetical protein
MPPAIPVGGAISVRSTRRWSEGTGGIGLSQSLDVLLPNGSYRAAAQRRPGSLSPIQRRARAQNSRAASVPPLGLDSTLDSIDEKSSAPGAVLLPSPPLPLPTTPCRKKEGTRRSTQRHPVLLPASVHKTRCWWSRRTGSKGKSSSSRTRKAATFASAVSTSFKDARGAPGNSGSRACAEVGAECRGERKKFFEYGSVLVLWRLRVTADACT